MNVRDKINQEMVDLSEKHNALFINHATGTGKTKSALDISLTVPGPHLIVHFEMTHYENLLNEINHFGFNVDDYVFSTYASLHKHVGLSYGTIILDECHHITENTINSLKGIGCQKFVALSAEVTSPKFRLLKSLAKYLYTHRITIEDAVKLDILPVPKVELHWMDLDNTKRNDYSLSNINNSKTTKYVKNIKEYFDLMNGNTKWSLDIRGLFTDVEYYEFINGVYDDYQAKIDAIDVKMSEINALIIKEPHLEFVYDINPLLEEQKDLALYKKVVGNKRKKFIAEVKSEYVTKLFNELKGKKLAFTNSIPSANALSINHIHSHVKKANVKAMIRKFKDGDIMELACVNMMKESHNIPKLDHVILQQMDISNVLGFIQVQGRALRSDKTILHLILVKDSIDQSIVEKLINNNLLKTA